MSLEATIHHKFHNPELLNRALTLGGYANENPGTQPQEVLCTLGDAVLKAIIVEKLMQKFDDAGDITEKKKEIESRENLALVARGFGVGDSLIMGKGEIKQDANKQDDVLAETLEAIIGAIFLDAGYEQCKKVVLGWKGIKKFL